MEILAAIEHDTEPPALRWGLAFVRGYLELGMLTAAERELAKLAVRFRCHADVIELRVRVLSARSRWEKAAWLARSAIKVYPGVAEFYLHAAKAYENLGRPEDARAVWISAPSLFHVSGMFHFNLARFEAKLGNRRSAREHIALAIELDPSMQDRAERDPGLRELLAG
jgi:tetratricopeptide (TPR) repeat protein